MEIRNCSECGYQFPFSFYVRKMVFKSVHTKWTCPDCGAILSVRTGRRFVLAVIAIVPVFSGIYILEAMKNEGMSRLLSWLLLMIVFFIWLVVVLSFDTYKASRK